MSGCLAGTWYGIILYKVYKYDNILGTGYWVLATFQSLHRILHKKWLGWENPSKTTVPVSRRPCCRAMENCDDR